MSKSVTRVTYNENAVIVLGCGLNTDGTPSETLKKRLDGCLDYYSKNSNCVIVVSGGHDRHADISEAEGMKIYLIDNGIPENKIFLEDKSQSTRENFEFSKQLLIENNIDYNSSVYITNSFHIYRAGLYAEQSGFESVNPLRVKTDIVVYIPAVLREIIAVCAVKLLNY